MFNKVGSIYSELVLNYMFVYLRKGLEKGAETPPPPPAEEPRTPSDEERSQSVELEIQGLNVSQVRYYFLVFCERVIGQA